MIVRSRLTYAAIAAGVTLVAVVASFCAEYVFCRAAGAGIAPAILAAVLVMGLSRRSPELHGWRALLVPVVLAGVALAAAGVGYLLLHVPLLGASIFVGGMALSIRLRDFGSRGRTAGALLAMPLIGLLVVPVPAPAPGGPAVDLALVIGAGFVAFVSATAVRALATRLGLPLPAKETRPQPVGRKPGAGLTPATRMALQMLVALTAAFSVGFVVFPGHWNWCVLTAYIVCGGAAGRGDALYKGVMRLGGAVAGTLAAFALASVWLPSGVWEAVAVFGALYFGLWLREVNYAYWACAITIVLALLSRSNETLGLALLGVRLEAILAGALCAVAAAWFVTPIRTEGVVRRRLADALLALDHLLEHSQLTPAEVKERHARFEQRMHELEGVAPPLRWHRRLFVRVDPHHPAEWIDLASALRNHAPTLYERFGPHEGERIRIRRAIGLSRRAIGDHGKAPGEARGSLSIRAALDRLHEEIAQTSRPG